MSISNLCEKADWKLSVLAKLTKLYLMRFTIWYHLYNLKNAENTHGGAVAG